MSKQVLIGIALVVIGVVLGSIGGGLGGRWFEWGYWINLILSITGFGLIAHRIFVTWVKRK